MTNTTSTDATDVETNAAATATAAQPLWISHRPTNNATEAETARPRTATITEPDVRPVTDDGDHDRFAHYTRKADANRAYVEGTPIRALCGKVWVPSRDPSRYPVCPECEKIRQSILRRASN